MPWAYQACSSCFCLDLSHLHPLWATSLLLLVFQPSQAGMLDHRNFLKLVLMSKYQTSKQKYSVVIDIDIKCADQYRESPSKTDFTNTNSSFQSFWNKMHYIHALHTLDTFLLFYKKCDILQQKNNSNIFSVLIELYRFFLGTGASSIIKSNMVALQNSKISKASKRFSFWKDHHILNL